MTYADDIAWIKLTQANAGKPGFNEYGVPLHACNGYRQDEHYWAWVKDTQRPAYWPLVKERLNERAASQRPGR